MSKTNKMSKDPAFLFYSKDWYEGTRTMLLEERACYMDLLVYQHQNGFIPNDIKRILMYCSGVDEATLIATLKAKFKQCDKGWFNETLDRVISERETYTNKQSINGTIGQFWKKCKANLTAKEYKEFRKTLENKDNTEIFEFLKYKTIDKATLKASLKALLKHLAIANAIEDVDVNEIEVKDETVIKEKSEKIIFPFQSKEFMAQWQLWKQFKKKEFGFNYRSTLSEQGALKKLSELSDGDEKTAIAIIHQSISEGWKGLFNLKNNGKQITGKQGASADFRRKTAERLGIVRSD